MVNLEVRMRLWLSPAVGLTSFQMIFHRFLADVCATAALNLL